VPQRVLPHQLTELFTELDAKEEVSLPELMEDKTNTSESSNLFNISCQTSSGRAKGRKHA
jgi:hypothetical protein